MRFGTERARTKVLKQLEDSPDSRAVPALISLIRRRTPGTYYAVRILRKCKDTRAIEALIAVVKDPESDSRDTAVIALLDIGDPAVVAPLINAMSMRDRRFPVKEVIQTPKIVPAWLVGGRDSDYANEFTNTPVRNWNA